MEKLAQKIAKNIGESLNYDTEKIAVIAYGLIALFQMISIFIVVFTLGLIGNFLLEGMLLFILVGLLRKSIGGAHSETFTGCLIFSIFCICFMAIFSCYFAYLSIPFILYTFSAIIFIWSYIMIYKLAPSASPKKPIINLKKISRLRKQAFITITLYLISIVILYRFSYLSYRYSSCAMSVTFAVLWQTFMLTKKGHKFMCKIDHNLVDFL